jgi:hypothetical protein
MISRFVRHLLVLCSIEVLCFCLGFAQGPDIAKILNRRLQTLSGDGAVNCGLVPAKENPKRTNKCVQKSFSAKRPFYARYDWNGTDSDGSIGLAGDVEGKVYMMVSDTVGWGGDTHGPELQYLDDNHIILVVCPTPIHFRHTETNGLTCLLPNKNTPILIRPKE